MKMRKRSGFTLVELIVVIAILGIVSAAILAVFQFTNTSFVSTNLLAEQQYEARMAMDLVKKEVGLAMTVVISDVIPTTLPTDRGYCYYDQANHRLILRTTDGNVHSLIAGLPASISTICQFQPIMIGGVYNTVNLLWQIGKYNLSTEVFIQNMEVHKGHVTTTYIMGDDAPPGIYLEYNTP